MLIFFVLFLYRYRDNIIFFFFSSRRRHTRWNCDWSSDVCSSDLPVPGDTATSAFSTRSLENSTLPSTWNGSGIGAHANIEARGGGTGQPARPKESTSTSRRRL